MSRTIRCRLFYSYICTKQAERIQQRVMSKRFFERAKAATSVKSRNQRRVISAWGWPTLVPVLGLSLGFLLRWLHHACGDLYCSIARFAFWYTLHPAGFSSMCVSKCFDISIVFLVLVCLPTHLQNCYFLTIIDFEGR